MDLDTVNEGRMFELNPRYKIKEHNEMLAMITASVTTIVFMIYSSCGEFSVADLTSGLFLTDFRC